MVSVEVATPSFAARARAPPPIPQTSQYQVHFVGDHRQDGCSSPLLWFSGETQLNRTSPPANRLAFRDQTATVILSTRTGSTSGNVSEKCAIVVVQEVARIDRSCGCQDGRNRRGCHGGRRILPSAWKRRSESASILHNFSSSCRGSARRGFFFSLGDRCQQCHPGSWLPSNRMYAR